MKRSGLIWFWVQKCFAILILCIALVAIAWGVQLLVQREAKRAAFCPRCNVVVFDIDILRADELTCNGKSLTITPNLCRIVRGGTSFSNTFSQSFWTLPGDLSLVTSLYPNANQVWSEMDGAIPQSLETLAETLGASGYQTNYQGINSDSTLTEKNGGLQGYTNINMGGAWPGNWLAEYKQQDFTLRPIFFHFYTPLLHMPYTLPDDEQPLENLPKPNGFPVYKLEFDKVQAEYIVSHVFDIFKPETIAENPNIFQADPSVRTERVFNYFWLLENQNDYTKRIASWRAAYIPYMSYIDTKKPQDIAYLHMLYRTRLRDLDTYLGSFVDYLMRPDVASRTIVVITSSHGEAFGEHGVFAHPASPYNILYHVPLVIKYPRRGPQKFDTVIENLDIYPTLVDMVVGVAPKHLQGKSLVPMLYNVSVKVKPYAASVVDEYRFIIQNRHYALIRYRDSQETVELYDLISDPNELHNIASKYPQIVKRYTRLLIQDVAPELLLPNGYMRIPNESNQKNLIKNGYF